MSQEKGTDVQAPNIQPEVKQTGPYEIRAESDDVSVSNIIPCPICQEPIVQGAKKCKHCDEYVFEPRFLGKTVWDWMGLLIIPLTLVAAGYFLADVQDRRQMEIEEARIEAQSTVEANRANANTLQAYLDEMSSIVLKEDLTDEAVLSAIRARTISTISELDGPRNSTAVLFLHETGLLNQLSLITINLSGANLTEADLTAADLSGADLTAADLSGADLTAADLSGADLTAADLTMADLIEADISWANLTEADLIEADLTAADLTMADLNGASLNLAKLNGANLSSANLTEADLTAADLTGADLTWAKINMALYNNFTKWPTGFDPVAAGAINIVDVETP